MTDNANTSDSNETLCSNLASETELVSALCQLWIQGVLLSIVGFCGIIGNLVSLYVLSRPSMASVFNSLLVSMTAFDTMYLAVAIAEFSFVESFHYTSEAYDMLFVYLLYPFQNVFLCCSVLIHVALAFERYMAVCHPETVYANSRGQRNRAERGKTSGAGGGGSGGGLTPAMRKKVLQYILPVCLISVAINIPRWLELKLIEIPLGPTGEMMPPPEDGKLDPNVNTTVIVAGTALRYNSIYVTYYLHWTILLLTGIFPLLALAVLNSRIYFRIKEVQKIRSAQSRGGEPNYAATLASIIVIFAVCHLPRVVKTIYEIIVTNQLIATGENCNDINPAKCLANFNNFILTLNAASNFLVYCFVGTFGTKFMEILTGCCCRRGGGGGGNPGGAANVSRNNNVANANGEASEITRLASASPSQHPNANSVISTSSSRREKLAKRLRNLKDISPREAKMVEQVTAV